MKAPLLLLPLIALSAYEVTTTPTQTSGASPALGKSIYNPGRLKPVDSKLKVAAGKPAPAFTLPATDGKRVSLSSYRGRKNVLLSFVPAAFTPVCSAQWPGYSLAYDVFDRNNTALLGITADNIPAQHAWITQMGGLKFKVLSDFYPHGAVANRYGLLRTNGVTERALVLIDKNGIIRWIDVHDINKRPPLEDLVKAMEKLP